jgi:hypothetical protein
MRFKRRKPIGPSKRSGSTNQGPKASSDTLNPRPPVVRRSTPNEPLVFTAGPLSTIRRMSEESLFRDQIILDQLGGVNVVRGVASLLARDIPPFDLAYALWRFLAHYAIRLLGPQVERELRPSTVVPLATAIRELELAPYEALAQKMLTGSYGYMRAQLERRESSYPIVGGRRCPVILGDYWGARRAFIQAFGAEGCRRTEALALLNLAVPCMANSLLNVLAPDFRPYGALEYILGWRESPECFLVSEVELALKKGDVEYAEQLCFDPGILNFQVAGEPLRYAPMKYRPFHVDTDDSEWRVVNAVGEALASSNWAEAESPVGYVVTTTWSIFAQRRNMHEQDRLNASRHGYSIEQYINPDILTDSPVDALIERNVDPQFQRTPFSFNQLGTTERADPASLNDLLNMLAEEVSPRLKEFLALRRKNFRLEDMAPIIGCTQREVKAAQQQWQRLKRGAIAKRLDEMQVPSAPGASSSVYRELLAGNPFGVLQHVPTDIKFPDGRPAAAAPVVEFRPDPFPASQAIRRIHVSEM